MPGNIFTGKEDAEMGFDLKTRSRAWTAVVHIQNMENMGLGEDEYKNPEFLAQHLTDLWNTSGKGRTSAAAVCVSADGLYHAHMALYGNTTTLGNVAKILFNSHVEPQLGGKSQLQAYLLKEGKYAEKGEAVLCVRDIDKVQDVPGKRGDLEEIEEMLIKGFTPQQILDTNFQYYKYEKMILHAYADMRLSTAPVKHKIYVEYHLGSSGTGKTYFYEQLCKEKGVENIYLMTDYDNNASGGLDSYMKSGAPPVLFMDEFKGFGISYGKLLTMLLGYTRMQTHARYSNAYNLWNEVYITSVYPPEVLYQNMVSTEKQDIDSYTQLVRRINRIVYHYIEDGEYKTYAIDSRDYAGYDDLRSRAASLRRAGEGFIRVPEAEQLRIPFLNDGSGS